jgi:threonine/homoserine/homoserine lactone efflux protein
MTFDSGAMLMLSVAPFALAMSLSPGPNNIMIAAIASRYGARRTVPYLLGTLTGVTALMLAAGFGLGEFFTSWPTAHAWLKMLGVAYLLWLAWRISTSPVSSSERVQRPFGFLTAVLFQWLNPKAWMMTLGAFSIFTSVGGELVAETVIITLTFILAFVPAVILWTGIGLSARHLLSSDRAIKTFNVSMGILIAASTVTVLL